MRKEHRPCGAGVGDATPSPCSSVEVLQGGCWQEAGQRQSLRVCPWPGRAAGRIAPSQGPRPPDEQGTARGRAWGTAQLDAKQTDVQADLAGTFHNVASNILTTALQTRQHQVVFTAAAPVCSVSRYFANPVVFGLKRKEVTQKTKP